MPNRGNGKFTCLGFVRGCLIGLALLIRFLVLWFVKWIIIKLSTELLGSCPSISWQVPSMVPAYHSHSWDLSSLEQYFALGPPTLSSSCSRYPIPTPTEFFYVMHMALSDCMQDIEKNIVFTIDFPLTKGLRHIVEIPPIFFFFLKKMILVTFRR